MKQPHIGSLAANVAHHRLHEGNANGLDGEIVFLRPLRIHLDIEHGVQRVQLQEVVVQRTRSRRTGAAITRATDADLPRAVREFEPVRPAPRFRR